MPFTKFITFFTAETFKSERKVSVETHKTIGRESNLVKLQEKTRVQ